MNNISSRNHCPFHFQQPFLCRQAISAAVAVEFAVFADDAVTGNHKRHGVGGVGASHSAVGVGMPDLHGDIGVGLCFAVGNGINCLQCFQLKWFQGRPVNGKGEVAAFAF